MKSIKSLPGADYAQSFFYICVFFVIALQCVAPIQANGASLENLEKVANAILIWDGNKPSDLFKAVKTANPDVPAIVSIGTAGNWVRTRAAGSSR